MSIEISMIVALYLYVFSSLIGFLFMGLIYFYIENKKQEYYYFFLFFVFNLLSALILPFRDSVGDFVGIIIANSFIVFAYIMIPLGTRTIFKQPLKLHRCLWTVLIYLTLFVVFTYGYYSVFIRTIILNVITMILLIYALYILYVEKKKQPLNEIMSVSILLLIAAVLVRIINTFVSLESHNELLDQSLASLYIILIGMMNLLVIPGVLSIFRSLQELELKNLSRMDELTKLENRRSLIASTTKLYLQSKRDQVWLSLFMIDVDDFKQFNDQFGHVIGDNILKDIGNVLTSVCRRPLDIVSRYGGDEFVVVLYGSTYEHSKDLAELVCHEVQKLPYHLEEAVTEPLKVSIGFVTLIASDQYSYDQIISKADENMYLAKADKTQCAIGTILK